MISNDFMVVPFENHLRVFVAGEWLCDVDSYSEAYEEINHSLIESGKDPILFPGIN